MSWAAIAATVVGAGLSAGAAAASRPDLVSPAKSSRKAVLASLRALPAQRKLEAAARLGQKVEYAEPNKRRKRTADFTGYGDADIQGKLAGELAGVQLELQKKYGVDFVNLARDQAEQADPQGTAARKLLASEINSMEDVRSTRERPVAQKLDAQLLADLQTGSGIDPEQQAAMDRVLARRGDVTGDVTGDLESGAAGESRLKGRLQKSMSYLGSGATPEDAAFRDEQQGLANMSSFLAGRTPQSQFASLSSAQQGAAPTVRAPGLPGVDPNLTTNAQQAGMQSYTAGVRSAANQVSPWFVGLSALTKGVQAYNAGRPA